MGSYSPERKAAVLAKMLPPHNQSIGQLSRQESIPANTLYGWRSQAGITTQPVADNGKSPQEWSQNARFAVLIETAPLSAHAVAEYCRRKGLYPEQLQQWKDGFMQPNPREEKALIKKQKKEIQQLNREIARKDKALAEAAALLILEKKFKALFGGGKRGRMTRAGARQQLIVLIQEAVDHGARLNEACRRVGLSQRTLQRWNKAPDDRRATSPRPVPKNKLSAEEEEQVLAICHEPRFASLAPAQIVPRLADEKRYVASESTFYRVLRRSGEMTRRGRQKAPQSKPLSTWNATGPNQLWSWDITWLASATAGVWFYLYLIEDVFSRKIVGYEVHAVESGEHAAGLLHRTVLSERCWQEPLVLHADNGAPMKSQTLQVKLAELKITASHSRPRVSNDNAHVESLFRTLKYVPSWPEKGFAALEDARSWVEGFVGWYNEEHRHGGIRYVTAGQRHRGEDRQLLAQRKSLYEAAKVQNPHRWSGPTRNWSWQKEVWLNPERETLAA
ncbi:IS3 family transposase [Serratia bockelmannii]|uniref:IS3 family transposase n=1 Tax=Serratia bockelmannii TaxID=2703793 RepID=UPI00235E3B2A|nr:IS3 family transposase [Serratia bockelmannii]HEJ7994518.1 IS3 family transposase [Serratia liquefaciens]